MKKGNRQHTAEFKFKVALEALKGLKTVSELSSTYEVHPSLINKWKKQLKEEGKEVFSKGSKEPEKKNEALQSALYEEIGRLKFELDWLKKKAAPFS